MLKQFFALLIITTFCFSCGNAPKEQTKEEAQSNQFFGETINTDNSISYENLLQKMNSSDSINVKVEGRVSAVCQKKGCWMNIVSDEDGQPEMFVHAVMLS